MTETTDHETYREWLELEVDGELGEAERRRLAAHLERCAACRAERRALEGLGDLLAADRVEVRPGFTDQVMGSLPAAGWEAASPRAWRLPVAVAAALVALATALVALGASEVGAVSTAAGAAGAVGDLLATAVLTGAGLLGASWTGTGLVVEEILASSRGGLVAFALLVVFLDALLIALLRRREPARARTTSPPGRR